MVKESINSKDLNKVASRILLFENSINYERMQSLAFTYSMIPVLEKLYEGEKLSDALKRHLQFFNTNVAFAGLVMGVTVSFEEEKAKGAEITDDTINGVKVGLMGPGAGIGDALFWGTLVPIIGGLAASLGASGSVIAPILHQIFRVGIYLVIIYGGVHFGYREGVKSLDKLGKEGIDRITTSATYLAAIVIGALVASLVSAETGLALNFGEMSFSVQTDLFDAIAPNILPFGIFLGTYYLMAKRKMSPIVVILIMFIVGIAGSYFNVLV